MADDITVIKRRQYGAKQETKQIPVSELPDYLAKGWVLNSDQLPEPEKPDMEVLELQHSDAKAELVKAEQEAHRIVGMAKAKVSAAELALRTASAALLTEDVIREEMQKQRDATSARDRAIEVFSSSSVPVPERVLIGLAQNENQARFMRENFFNNDHFVGTDEAGDRLFVMDKAMWQRKKAEIEAAAAAEKENAIRARMEAK